MLLLMRALDKGSNAFGALRPDIRARLYAVVDNPGQDTWEDAHTIIIDADGFTTLWQAVGTHAGYPVRSKDLERPWPIVPTREQLLTALCAELGVPTRTERPCTQCGPGHDRGDGRCARHGKAIRR